MNLFYDLPPDIQLLILQHRCSIVIQRLWHRHNNLYYNKMMLIYVYSTLYDVYGDVYEDIYDIKKFNSKYDLP